MRQECVHSGVWKPDWMQKRESSTYKVEAVDRSHPPEEKCRDLADAPIRETLAANSAIHSHLLDVKPLTWNTAYFAMIRGTVPEAVAN